MAYTLNKELGCVYDTLRFFTLHFHSEDDTPEAFIKFEDYLNGSGITIEKYLLPFYQANRNQHSWFSSLFRQGHDDMTLKRVETVLGNRRYLAAKLFEYFFPTATPAEVSILQDPSNPQILEIIKKHIANSQIELDLLFILLHLNDTLDTFSQTVLSVLKAVQNLHNSFLSKENSFVAALNEGGMIDKLIAIVGTKPENALSCALSLLAPDCISYSLMKPQSIILGTEFKRRVDIDYRYCNVTPYSFVNAIGSITKYEIFKIFLHHYPSPISAADIAKQYYTSRNTLTYNLREMLSSGIIMIDHVKGQSYFYMLDMEYVRVVGEKLISFCE